MTAFKIISVENKVAVTAFELAPPLSVEAERFSGRLALVAEQFPSLLPVDRDDLRFYHPSDYCYIDKTGKVSIKGPFMEARPFVNGLAAVMLAGKWGYTYRSGRVVVPFKYIYWSAQNARDEVLINLASAMCRSILYAATGAKWGEPSGRLSSNTLPDQDVSREILALYEDRMKLAIDGHWAESALRFIEAWTLAPGFFAASGALTRVLTEQRRYGEAIHLL